MAMQHFFLKLISPRATFAIDMSESERAIMTEHAAYIRGFYEAGSVLAYGPVMADDGPFGMAIVEMPDVASVEAFAADDPAVKSALCRCQISSMHLIGPQLSRTAS